MTTRAGRSWANRLRAAALGVAALLAMPRAAAAEAPVPAPDLTLDVDWDVAYARLAARGRPHYLRAFLEESAIVGAGAIWYWADADRQRADWDFPSLKQRFSFDVWRFDTNPFPINFAWHPVDGGQYHVIGRANDLSLLASIGYGFGTSLIWEYGLEYREKFSVNDMVTTTGGGVPVGEFLHWLGRYLESAPSPRSWHPVARWLLTTVRTAHVTLDGRDTLRRGTTPDALGLSDDIWHRFHLSAGFVHGRLGGAAVERAATRGDGPTLAVGEVRATGELVAIPGYLRARHLRRTFADGNVTSAQARLALGGDAIGLELGADAIVAGWHGQDLDAAGVGHATTVGLNLAYRYRRELLGTWRGRLGQIHLPGLAVDHHQRRGAAGVRVRARLNPDFAGVHAADHAAWDAANPDAVEKTILRKHGYYFGWGGTARLEVEATLPRVDLGASYAYSRYASHEGIDRDEEDVTGDITSADSVHLAEGWLRVAPLRSRLYLEARVTHEARGSRTGEFASDRSLTRLAFALGAAL